MSFSKLGFGAILGAIFGAIFLVLNWAPDFRGVHVVNSKLKSVPTTKGNPNINLKNRRTRAVVDISRTRTGAAAAATSVALCMPHQTSPVLSFVCEQYRFPAAAAAGIRISRDADMLYRLGEDRACISLRTDQDRPIANVTKDEVSPIEMRYK